MSRADRWFKRLLRFFPAEFRGDFGDDMTQTFKDQRDETVLRGDSMAQLRLWKDTVIGIFRTAPREHWDLLRQDIRYGLRNLRRNPGFAVVAIAALAVGIGANTGVFTIVNGVLLEPLPFREPNRLVTISEQVQGVKEKFGFAAPDFAIIRDATQSFQGIAAYGNVSYELSGQDRSERVVATRVTPEIFGVLGVAPAMGHAFTQEEDATNAKVAILSDGLWRRQFGGDPNILGRTIALDREPYVIVGVMPKRFVFPTRGSASNGEPGALYIPMSFTPGELRGFGSQYNKSTVARLKPGVTMDQARADLGAAGKVLAPQYPASLRGLGEGLTFPITPLDEELVGRSRRLLLVLMGAVGLVLLICCADIANLMLTRSGARARELAIRSALGASQIRVVRQLLTESMVLAVIGAAAGLFLAYGITQAFLSMAGETLPRLEGIRFNARGVAFTIGLAFTSALIFGVLPALRTAHMSSASSLKDSTRGATASRRRHRMLGALVVAQCALALILSVGAGLLIRSFVRLMHTDTGFHAERVVNATMVLPTGRYQNGADVKAFYQQAVAAARAIPGVTVAGAATERPLNIRAGKVFTPDSSAQPGTGGAIANVFPVGNYFETLGIPLKSGRLFTASDGQPNTERVAIISEMLARRLWPNGDAVGHQIKWGIPASPLPWMTVVGVVGDVKQGALDAEILPLAYEPLLQAVSDTAGRQLVRFYGEVNLAVRSDRPADAIIGELRHAISKLDPQLAISKVQPVAEIVDDSVKTQRFSTTVLTIFAAVALSLAALGIYGVLANLVVQQRQEIGVRMALGAERTSVIWLVMKRALTFTAIGAAIGLAGAIALTRLIGGLLYGTTPYDAVAFAGASAGLALLVMVASLIPAWRATRVDPIVALRAD